jgi:hypothetical protein
MTRLKRNGRATLGAFALAAVMVIAPATTASADVAGPFPSLKECEKTRETYIKFGYIVGSCQKMKAPGFYRFLYETY